MRAVRVKLVKRAIVGLVGIMLAVGLATGCVHRKVATTEPQTSNVFVDEIVQTAVNKIDLLFMVDNSASMADKQDILRTAVPVLVGRLVSPICVDATTGAPTGGNADSSGKCATGEPEFTPISDIHVGIVTSSLGSHGGTVCVANAPSGGQDNPLNDNGQLIGKVRPTGSNPSERGGPNRATRLLLHRRPQLPRAEELPG